MAAALRSMEAPRERATSAASGRRARIGPGRQPKLLLWSLREKLLVTQQEGTKQRRRRGRVNGPGGGRKHPWHRSPFSSLFSHKTYPLNGPDKFPRICLFSMWAFLEACFLWRYQKLLV